MARTGIIFEEVQNAAESLLGRGLNPTIQRVREVLGTGSNTTISEHLKTWQQQLAEAPKMVLPPTIPEAVMTALDGFWKIAVQSAEAAFEERRTAAMQAIQLAEQNRDQAIAAQHVAESQATQRQQQLEAISVKASELAEQLLIEQERRSAAEATISVAEQRAQAAIATATELRTEAIARVQQLEMVLQQARHDLSQQNTEFQQLLTTERQRAEATEIRLSQLLEQQHSEWTAERQAFTTERNDWKNQEKTWEIRLNTQERDHATTRETLAVATERQRRLADELQQLRTQLEQTETRHLEAWRIAENLRGELKAALETRPSLEPSTTQKLPSRQRQQKTVPASK